MSDEKASGLTPQQAKGIADAVRNIELSTTDAWSDLDILSSRTQIEAVEMFTNGIVALQRQRDRHQRSPRMAQHYGATHSKLIKSFREQVCLRCGGPDARTGTMAVAKSRRPVEANDAVGRARRSGKPLRMRRTPSHSMKMPMGGFLRSAAI